MLLADIHPERAEETQTVIEAEDGTASVFAGDITQTTDAAAMVRAAVDAYGTVDVLVNNIGAAIYGSVVDTSEDDWDRSLAVSLRTTFLASRRGPGHGRQGLGGHREHRVDFGATGTGFVGYSAAKGGVHTLTVDMAYSHGRDGIRVPTRSPPATSPRRCSTPCSATRPRPSTAVASLPRPTCSAPKGRAGTSPPLPCSSPATRPVGSRASHCPSTAACSPRHHC